MSKNIHYYNGWKSNKGYYVNKKVIVPLQAWSSWGSCLYYPAASYLLDLEKCFNYLDGGLTESIDLKKTLEIAEREGQTRNIVLKYFKVTFYKKGTCHITFTNEDLLKKFNIFAGKYKNWLPPSYGKKAYNDMSEGEKQVVNEFEGEDSYKRVIENKDYFLFDTSNLCMIEEKQCN